MNNTLTITNASLPPSPAEIEPSTSRCRIPIRRFRNCLSLPETAAAISGTMILTAGALTIGFAAFSTLGIPLMITGGAVLLYGSMIAAMRSYHREFPSSLVDIETQSPLPPAPEQADFQHDFFTSTTPPPYTEQSIPPPAYEESCNFPNTPPPAYEESCTLSSMLPQPSPTPTNEDDSRLPSVPPTFRTYF